jgi:hypothetical protein
MTMRLSRFTFLLAFAALVNACATPSKYRAEQTGRASLFFDGDPILRVEGTQQGEKPDGWLGGFIYPNLSRTVSCVPMARGYADVARREADTLSTGSAWTLGVLLGSMVGGVGLIAYGASQDKEALAFSGLGVMTAGIITSLVLLGSYAPHRPRAEAATWDAINAYNDNFQLTPGCPGALPASAQLAAPMAATVGAGALATAVAATPDAQPIAGTPAPVAAPLQMRGSPTGASVEGEARAVAPAPTASEPKSNSTALWTGLGILLVGAVGTGIWLSSRPGHASAPDTTFGTYRTEPR